MKMTKTLWWKCTHGEWYVIAQIVLTALVFFGPRTCIGWSAWIFPPTLWNSIGGGVILLIGILLLAAAIFRLGSNLTPVPYPKEKGALVETGPYRIVRHPMYCGGILIAFGWALCVYSWLTIGYAVMMLLFFDIKSRREEKWLQEKFLGYGEYQKRVSKLIPFIY